MSVRANLLSQFPRGMMVAVLLTGVFWSGCKPTEPPPLETPRPVEETPVNGATQKTSPASHPTEHPAPQNYVNQLTPEQIQAGWLLLFDNESQFGWVPDDPQVNWRVEEEALVADDGPIGLLLTQVRFTDFELSLEFKGSPGSNGGVFLRTSAHPEDPATDCYEVNIADEHPQGFLTGSIVAHQPADPGFPTTNNEWHRLNIVAIGNTINVRVDDTQMAEFRDERAEWRPSGLIGLQKNAGSLAYRNIQLKPLGSRDLFNGVDLAGWREVPGGKSVIDVVEASIHVVNGPGFLETEETFQDFILQWQYFTHAPRLNSGLFFRTQPGTEEAPSNGYEVQIHNGFLEGDRNRPEDAGTGGIFRRQDARRVVADDETWSTVTLIADGPRFATWVEGYPVVNWLDERASDANPRRGLRLDAGHLSLQGHDPTTDLSFRNIRLAPLPPTR